MKPKPPKLLRLGAWRWFDPVYRVNFFLLCCDKAEVPKRIRKLAGEEHSRVLLDAGMNRLDGINGRMLGTRQETYGQTATIWLKPNCDTGIVVHEALHAVYYVLDSKGLTLTDSSEEAFTYYLEWTVREIARRVGH